MVSAQKRPENLQNSSAAITALSGETLQAQGVLDTNALENLIPSANFKQSASASMLFIRGVGTSVSAAAVDPGVSFNLNGVYVPREGTGGNGILYDVAQVEALPGPQGTLWGRGSAGGALNVVTNAPTRQFEGSAFLEIGNYGALHNTDVINVPVSDKVQLRGAFNVVEHDGYLSNGANDADTKAGRLTLAIEPSADLNILVHASYSHDGGVGSFGINKPLLDAGNPWYTPRSKSGLYQDNVNMTVNAEIKYQLDDLVLTYIPGWDFVDIDNVLWASGFNLGGYEKEHQYSQELRLESDGNGRLKWVVGGYYYNFALSFNQSQNGAFVLLLPQQTEISAAGFGQATYSITDALRLTLGGRYSSDSKKALGQANNAQRVLTPFSADISGTHGDFKIGAEADLGARSMAYAAIQTGYVPGSYSNVPNSPTFSNEIAPETLTSYSMGIKNRFFDNRLEVNDEVFYYDYKDFQVTARNAGLGVTTTQSAERVGIYGDQLDLKLLLTPDDRLRADVGFLHSRYLNFGIGAVSYNGFQTVDSPDFTASLGYDHRFILGNGDVVSASVDSHVESSHWANFQHSPGLQQAGYSKTNLSVTYTPADGHWWFGAFVDNVENAAVMANGAASGPPVFGSPGPSGAFIEPPRTYGVRGKYAF